MKQLSAALALLLILAAGSPAAAQDQKAIDAAIDRGIAYLKTAGSPKKVDDPTMGSDELILWTFVKAGVSPSDGRFQELLKYVLEVPLERTYKVALQAMILEEIDRVKYQGRIAQCGQFLVDNQCLNGQWAYGTPTTAVGETPTTSGSKDVASAGGVREFGAGEKKEKPKVTRKINVRQTRTGPAEGDNSNSQYAALGLRACHDAGIVIPKGLFRLAKQGLEASQHKDDPKSAAKGVASGSTGGTPRGWCYDQGADHPAYGSMTAGAVGSLAIYDHLLGADWKKNAALKDGLAWMGANFSVTDNLGPCQHGTDTKTFYYYYLYALERSGMLLDLPQIGNRDWYAEGVKVLLPAQRPDGVWTVGDAYMHHLPAWDTCYAILFLKRATRPLVASEDPTKKPR